MGNTAPTYAEFIAVFSAFSGVDDGVVQDQLSMSAALLDVGTWGAFYSNAVALDTAHNLAISEIEAASANGSFQAAVGPVNSVSGAGVNIGFATPSMESKDLGGSRAWYSKTSYGQRFLRLRSAVCPMGDVAS